MADTDENKETEIKKETEAAPKPKAKPKTKAKPKAKPKAKKASEANTDDVAPYVSKGNNAASAHTQESKGKFPTIMVLMFLAMVAVIIGYTLNKPMSEQSAQAGSQNNTVNAELDDLSAQVDTTDTTATPAAETKVDTQAEPANIQQASAVIEAPKQDAAPANQAPLEQAATQALANTEVQTQTQAQARSAEHYEKMQQRRQEFEKRMQLKKQEYDAIVEAHNQERAKLDTEQNDLMLRIRKKNAETKLKVDEIRNQIYDLHQQINQIMRESHQVQRQR